MKFSENLKYLRKQANLTQERLAEELNVSRQAITKWESGQSMPDIENLKELSYIFSIPIDNLIGDIECKSSLRIHRKINDIGWFIFPFIILYIFATISVSEFIVYISNNEDLVFPTVAIMIVLGIILFTISIKKWLNEKTNIIVDMTDTKEGRKARKKLLAKELLIEFIKFNFVMLLLDLPTPAMGFELFVKHLIMNIIFSIIFATIYGIISYKKIEKMVKEFNENV